jgi:hypothetical protein
MRTYRSTNDVFDLLCTASMLGNLGLFVGSGFTKAALKDNDQYEAYSWYELLEKCCEKMNVEIKILKSKGSYSEIASLICKQYAINEKKPYSEGIALFKETVSNLTNVYPTEGVLAQFQEQFDNLNINWIVTTNYDTILESIFIGKSLPLGPYESFINVRSLIPIFHIHGTRNFPNDIVITNEDYVSLFRPNDYRQARLPFLIKESVVLMIGYGLGDINVISALDWCNNVYTNVNDSYEMDVVQLLYTVAPKDKPYRDDSGVLIVEIANIMDFFTDLNTYFKDYEAEYEEKTRLVNEYIKAFVSSLPKAIDGFIDNDDTRKKIIKYITNLNPEYSYIYPSYISFLKNVIINLNERALPRNAFEAYNEKVKVLIDIFEYLDIKTAPPSFFSFLAESLDNVAVYLGKEKTRGAAWSAIDTWQNENSRIPSMIKEELLKYCKAKNGCFRLRALLE